MAAILAAVACYLEAETESLPQPNPWLLQGRKEQLLRRDPRHWQRGRREAYDSPKR